MAVYDGIEILQEEAMRRRREAEERQREQERELQRARQYAENQRREQERQQQQRQEQAKSPYETGLDLISRENAARASGVTGTSTPGWGGYEPPSSRKKEREPRQTQTGPSVSAPSWREIETPAREPAGTWKPRQLADITQAQWPGPGETEEPERERPGLLQGASNWFQENIGQPFTDWRTGQRASTDERRSQWTPITEVMGPTDLRFPLGSTEDASQRPSWAAQPYFQKPEWTVAAPWEPEVRGSMFTPDPNAPKPAPYSHPFDTMDPAATSVRDRIRMVESGEVQPYDPLRGQQPEGNYRWADAEAEQTRFKVMTPWVYLNEVQTQRFLSLPVLPMKRTGEDRARWLTLGNLVGAFYESMNKAASLPEVRDMDDTVIAAVPYYKAAVQDALGLRDYMAGLPPDVKSAAEETALNGYGQAMGPSVQKQIVDSFLETPRMVSDLQGQIDNLSRYVRALDLARTELRARGDVEGAQAAEAEMYVASRQMASAGAAQQKLQSQTPHEVSWQHYDPWWIMLVGIAIDPMDLVTGGTLATAGATTAAIRSAQRATRMNVPEAAAAGYIDNALAQAAEVLDNLGEGGRWSMSSWSDYKKWAISELEAARTPRDVPEGLLAKPREIIGKLKDTPTARAITNDLTAMRMWIDDMSGVSMNPLRWTGRAASAQASADADTLFQAFGRLINGVTNTEDIKKILTAWTQDPKRLIEGLGDLVTETYRGGVYRAGPGIVGNAYVTRAYPILKNAAEDLLKMKALAKPGSANLPALIAETYEVFSKHARKLAGLAESQPPLLRRVIQGPAAADGVLPWLGDAWMVPATIVRGLLSDGYLALRFVGNPIRNALSAAYTAAADDTMTFMKRSELIDQIDNIWGVSPSYRLYKGQTGLENVLYGSQEGQHWIGRLLGPKYNNNIYSKAVTQAARATYGDWELFGRVPASEEAFRERMFGAPALRAWNNGKYPAVKQVLTPIMDELGIAPEMRSPILDKLAASMSDGKAQFLRTYRDVLAGVETKMDARTFLPPEIAGTQLWSDLNEVFRRYGPDQVDVAAEDVRRAFVKAKTEYGGEVMAMDPPAQGVTKFSENEVAYTIGDVSEDIYRAAIKAGMTPQEAAERARQVGAMTRTSLDNAYNGLANDVAASERVGTVRGAMDTLSRIQGQRWATRMESDKLTQNALTLNTPQAWKEKLEGTDRLWQGFTQKVDALVTDGRTRLLDPTAQYDFDAWFDMVNRYANYDELSVRQLRTLDAASYSRDKELFGAVVDANRQYVDRAIVELYDAVRQYPSRNSFDTMVDALRKIDQQGAMTAAQVNKLRAQRLDNSITAAQYQAKVSALWKDSFDESVNHAIRARRYLISVNSGDWPLPEAIQKTTREGLTATDIQYAKGAGLPEGYGVRIEAVKGGGVKYVVMNSDGTTSKPMTRDALTKYARKVTPAQPASAPAPKAAGQETWLTQNAQTYFDATAPETRTRIAQLSAQRRTAKQIADELGLTEEQVRLVRSKMGIPSQTIGIGAAQQPNPDFEKWLSSQTATPAPAAATQAAQAAPAGVTQADQVRRMASDLGMATATTTKTGRTTVADQRVLNHLRKRGLDIPATVKTIDALDPAQMSEAARILSDEVAQRTPRRVGAGQDVVEAVSAERAETAGRRVAAGSSEDVVGQAEFNRNSELARTGKTVQQAPAMGEVAAEMNQMLDDVQARILDELQGILSGTPLQLTPQQKTRLMDAMPQLQQMYDELAQYAGQIGVQMSDFGLLNYADQSKTDAAMSFVIPFPYFWTNHGWNWATRVTTHPSYLNQWYQMDRAMQREFEQSGLPERYRGTVPNPLYGTDIPVVGDVLRWQNPAALAMPAYMYMPNGFDDPAEAAGDMDYVFRTISQFMPGAYTHLEYMRDAYLDQTEPMPNGQKRTDSYKLGDMMPYTKAPGYMYMYTNGEIPNWGPFRPPTGTYFTVYDEWDPYRQAKQRIPNIHQNDINNGVQKSPYSYQYAQQIVANVQMGRARFQGVPQKYQAEADEVYRLSVRQVGYDMLVRELTGFAGLRGYTYPDEAMRPVLNEYYAARDVQNPGKSKAAVQNMYDTTAIGTYQSGSAFTPWGVSTATPGQSAKVNEAWDIKGELYDKRTVEAEAAVNALPEGASWDDMKAARAAVYDKYKPLIDEQDAIIAGSGERIQSSVDYRSDWEKERDYLNDVFDTAQNLPGRPGDGASSAEWDAYRQAQLDYVMSASAGQAGIHPYEQVGQPIKTFTPDEVEKLWLQESNKNYTERQMQYLGDLEQRIAANEATWAARKQAVYSQFGEEAGGLYEQYLALPKGEARAAFKAEHPVLRAVSLYTWNPNEYADMQERFGQDAILAWANTPKWAEDEESRKARSAYYDANPDAFLVGAWLNGRPGASEAEVTDDETYTYNWGKDFLSAQEQFGENIWTVVAGYQRGWDKATKSAYFDANPNLSPFFAWWYANLPDNKASTAQMQPYGYRTYWGGGGGGWGGARRYEKASTNIPRIGLSRELQMDPGYIGQRTRQWRPQSADWGWYQPLPVRSLRNWRD